VAHSRPGQWDQIGHHAALRAVRVPPVPTSVDQSEGERMASRLPDTEELLTPAEVAALFRVDPKTVTRWAKAGKLTSIRTLGGHRRYRAAEVRALLGDIPAQRETDAP